MILKVKMECNFCMGTKFMALFTSMSLIYPVNPTDVQKNIINSLLCFKICITM